MEFKVLMAEISAGFNYGLNWSQPFFICNLISNNVFCKQVLFCYWELSAKDILEKISHGKTSLPGELISLLLIVSFCSLKSSKLPTNSYISSQYFTE